MLTETVYYTFSIFASTFFISHIPSKPHIELPSHNNSLLLLYRLVKPSTD